MNKLNLSFNMRFAIAVFFSIAACVLITYIAHLLFDTDTAIPVLVPVITMLLVNYKKMKTNYKNNNHG